MIKIITRFFLIGLLGSISNLALAHHSFSMFDQNKQVTIAGKVAEVQWTNPHVWIFLDVANPKGGTERWGVEFTSKVHLTRRGFAEGMVKANDQVEITINPYANGKNGGRFVAIKMANGQYYCDVGAGQSFCADNKK